MKTTAALSLVIALLSTAAWSGRAATYSDATGEGSILTAQPHLDITSVEVNNNATALTFKINLAGSPIATDWGKYLIGIDSAPGGDPTGNGWGRPIGMSSGMDYFVGSWADSGNGAEIRNWTGSAWNLQSATYNPNPDSLSISKDASSVTLMFNFAGLGMTAGSSFLFDVYTTGGGGSDSAIDALGNAAQTVANWNDPYNSGANVRSYPAIPEPTTGLLLAAGLGLMALCRRGNNR